ncbi:MAG: hypothetical protein WAT52_02095 [Chitinophagales bacterium]
MDINKFNNSLIVFYQCIYKLINQFGLERVGNSKDSFSKFELVLLDILERVNRNIQAISILIEASENLIEHNRQPLMLLLRGIVEDLFIAMHLSQFRDDEIVLQNELNVLQLDYIKFSLYIIRREPHYSHLYSEFVKLKTPEEQQKYISELLNRMKVENQELFKNSTEGDLSLKSPKELRDIKDLWRFNYIDSEGTSINLFNEKINISKIAEMFEHLGKDDKMLKNLAYGYIIYRVLSQYQHYSHDISSTLLNRDQEFEISIMFWTTQTIALMIQILINMVDKKNAKEFLNCWEIFSKTNK